MSSADLPLIAGAFVAALPAASAPWQPAHFDLKSFSPPACSCANRDEAEKHSTATIAIPRHAFFIFFSFYHPGQKQIVVLCAKFQNAYLTDSVTTLPRKFRGANRS